MPVFSLIVYHLDVVQISIGPVHQSVHQVQCDTVGEDDLGVNQLCAVLAIHVTALHPRSRPIVCEENLTAGEQDKIEMRITNYKKGISIFQ